MGEAEKRRQDERPKYSSSLQLLICSHKGRHHPSTSCPPPTHPRACVDSPIRRAALTGGTLRLERALDDKERELQLQRVEIHGLREHLRAVEAAARGRATPGSAGGNPRLGVRSNGTMQPSSLLAPVWGGSGSGRGGTAPYPNEGGSRPVSASDGWMDDQQAGGGGGAGESQGGGGGGVGRLSYSGNVL
ncbi:unnamed protein product, partial [Ectocarpus sp. 6 AP-2014]